MALIGLATMEKAIKEIERIRASQERMYSNMDRFTVQIILTHLHNSPMTVDEVLQLQKHITKNISEKKVIALLDDLVENGYAEKTGFKKYHYTNASKEALENEGITKEILFN